MADLPSGTVIFLFTDIEGSTRLWEEYPAEMSLALARHDALLRETVEAHCGHVVKTAGDGFCCVFDQASHAVAAALNAQRALPTLAGDTFPALRVRMALHAGTAELRDGDYYGSTLNRVARLMAAGHGGQTLLSEAAKELVRDDLPVDAELKDLGKVRLRDLQQPERVFQLLHPDLPTDFPSLKSLDTLPNNLPAATTSFIGRQKEIAEIKSLPANTRLLTLMGTGGCGKTRLALQIAAEMLDSYPDGVWFIELAALTDPLLVPETIASLLTVREEPGKSILQTLTERLQTKKLLLVLDNCEHLAADCAQLADTLLHACPDIKIMATSREALNTAGEVTYRVPSLGLPDLERPLPLEMLRECEAVRLFAERAVLHQPQFAVTTANASLLAQICRRLDGIPLGIELAAARIKTLTVSQIASRLDDQFRFLTGGSRTALPRQQTLRATMDWSYALLSETERKLLQRLSLFTGGWSLEAAEYVCAEDARETDEVLDRLTSLVDKSLVIVDVEGEEARYRLLETMRRYSLEKLGSTGEESKLHRKHFEFYLRFAKEASRQIYGEDQTSRLDQLEIDHDNFRSALEWNRTVGDDSQAQREMVKALWQFWAWRGYITEGRRWLEEAVSRSTEEESGLRSHLRITMVSPPFHQGDFASVRPIIEEELTLLRRLSDKEGMAIALRQLANGFIADGDLEAARRVGEESLAIDRELGNLQDAGWSLCMLGRAAMSQGDRARARSLFEESLNIFRQAGNKEGCAWLLLQSGIAAYDEGDFAQACPLLEESRDTFLALGNKAGVPWSLYYLAWVAHRQGDYARALSLYRQSLEIKHDLGDIQSLTGIIEGVAGVAAAQGQPARAARLFGAAQALRGVLYSPVPPYARQDYERDVAATRTALGEQAFAAAWAEGQTFSQEQTISLILTDEICI